MTSKIDHNFWERYFKVYDVLNYVIPYQELLDAIVEKLEVKEGDLALDAGCGTGNLAIKMKEKGASVIGLDNCMQALERYQEKYQDAEIVLLSLTEKLPFADNTFDKLATNNVIYTLKKEERIIVFKEFFRVLKPGGKIVVSNVCRGNSVYKIFFDSVSMLRKKTGLLSTIRVVIKMIVPTIKMFIYNELIHKENRNGSFDYVEQDEQFCLLRNSGFQDVSENVYVYSKQAIMNYGVKP